MVCVLWAFLLLPFTSLSLGADCLPVPAGKAYRVDHIYDGDSVRLHDGRRLRLIGINAPELGRDGRRDEPFALQARKRLEALIREANGVVMLRKGPKSRDRHRRHLVYLFTPDGEDLGEVLLREGLAVVIALPPNIDHLPCYTQAETLARQSHQGLWRRPPTVSASSLSALDKGFRLVSGRVSRVGSGRHSVWLTLDAVLSVRIDRRDLDLFPALLKEAREGRRLEVRGWLHRYRGAPTMRVRHPSMLKWLKED